MLHHPGIRIRRRGKQIPAVGILEQDIRLDFLLLLPVTTGGDGRLEDTQPRREDLATLPAWGRPVRGGVAFHRGQRRDGVDVNGTGDEEDALDGIRGERLPRRRVDEVGHDDGRRSGSIDCR